MKRVFLSLLIISILFAACKGRNDKITIKDEKGNKATIDVSSVNEAAKKIEENANEAEKLKKLTPLSIDQVKALIPDELLGMKRSSFSANSAMGVSVGEGTYKGDEDKELKLEIIDCAGETGAAWYNMRFFALWNFQQEDDNGYQKTVDFNGGKAVEKYTKSNDRYELTYFAGDLFIVQLEGEKVGLDAMKQVASNLSLKAN
jgi:hypothetical protein